MNRAWWLVDLGITLAATAFLAVFAPFAMWVTYELQAIGAQPTLVGAAAALAAIVTLVFVGCCLTLRDLIGKRPDFRKIFPFQPRNTTPR